MSRLFRLSCAALVLLAFSSRAIAQEPDKDDPAAELASFKLAPGFEANLWASEKDGVVKPIQIRWDTRGRLWVIQSTTYPQIKPGEEPNDKVLILEDTAGAGRADKVTVFADGLMIPTGLEIAPAPDLGSRKNLGSKKEDLGSGEPAAANSGPASLPKSSFPNPKSAASLPKSSFLNPKFASACYVGEGTKLWLLTDTDGDGRADRREIVLRGFGTGDNHQNINSFRWSPGGELFFSQGLHGFARIETPYGIVGLNEAGFWRFRPREQRLDAFYGGRADPQNPWGFVWTDWGQMLMVAGNNGGIFWPLPEMIRGVQGGRRDSIWVNARGRKTSGPDIVGTAHFPPEWQGVFLTGGYINNAIWALDIFDDGAGFKLTDREPLLTSTHGSFRPVDVKFGPDGALYVCDWYNPIIGHYQASFRHPDRDKTHGRIWRITARGRPLVKPPPIASAPIEALLENLKSPERWVREQSKRELAGRPTEEVVEKARAWWRKVDKEAEARFNAEGAKNAEGRRAGTAQAKDSSASLSNSSASSALKDAIATEHTLFEVLGVFETHDEYEPHLLARVLRSNQPDVRVYAAAVVARWRDRMTGLSVDTEQLATLVQDGDPRVRTAAVVAAANMPGRQSLDILVSAPKSDGDKFFELAAQSAFAALKPVIVEFMATTTPKWPLAWRERFLELSNLPKKPPAVAATSVAKTPPAVPSTGKLKATPDFVAALVKEVRSSGDAKHGADVFRRAELACTACHSIEDKGGKIGPPLDAIGSGQPLDFIIGAVLEPQREIKESYEAVQIIAKDGRIAAGYIAARDDAATTLHDPGTGGETRFATAEIAETKQLGSFMPAGLVDHLPREDLRDLFRYLSELGKPRP